MAAKPTYEALEQRIKALEQEAIEHKQVEKALLESARKLRAIFDNAYQFIGLMTVDGTLIEANRSALNFAGVEAKDVLGKPFWETIWWTHSTEMQTRLQKAVSEAADGHFVRFEAFHPAPDGRIHYVDISITPVKDAEGNVYLLIPEGRDITDSKEAERLLKFTQFTIDQAKIAIFWCHADGRFFYVNDKACEWLQYSRDELMQMHVADINPEFPRDAWPDHWKEIKEKGLVLLESVHCRKNGEIYPVEIYSNYVEFEGQEYKLAFVHDISEYRQTEKSFKESEATLRSIFRAAPTGIGMVYDRVIQQANERLCEMLGYSQKELLGKSARMVYPSDEDYEYVGREKYVQIQKKGTGTVETRWQKKNGEVIDVLLSSTPIDPVDLLAGVTFTALDITGRKQAEEALQKRAQELAALNILGRRVSANLSLELVVQSALEQITSIVAPDLAMVFLREDDTLIIKGIETEGTQYALTYTPVHRLGECLCGLAAREGKPIYAVDIHNDPRCTWDECKEAGLRSFAAMPLLSGDETIGVLGIASAEKRNFKEQSEFLEAFSSEVSIGLKNAIFYEQAQNHAAQLEHELQERRIAEEALKESHMTLITVLDSIDATIYVADMATYEILFMNKYMQDSFGSNLEGKICWEAFRGESKPCDHCTNTKLIDHHGNPTGVIVWEDKNPVTDKWYLNYDRAIRWTDGRLVKLQVATDTTAFKNAEKEQKRLESQLRQTQKMEAIGTLAGGIAHDFNNILAAIIGYTEIAMHDAPKGSELQINLQKVLKGGDRAKDLVKQILAFSRQSEIEPKPVKVKTIVQEALKLLRASLPTTIEIRRKLQSNAVVMADPTQIHQIVMNLCANAGQAMHAKGGILDINLGEVRLDAEFAARHPEIVPGVYIKLAVKDTGHGIPAEIQDRVFDPFFTTRQHGEGTGLGLAVVHGIVKSHGGAMTVASDPKTGSVFNVFLPAIEEQFELGPTVEKTVLTGTERILFIDDEEPLTDMGKIMLESLGYDVVAKTSSIEALELFKADADRFDLVITDLTMPHMTGDNLAKELMQIRPDIPIILCTGFSARIDETKAMAMGIRAFISKPILRLEIAEVIRTVIDG